MNHKTAPACSETGKICYPSKGEAALVAAGFGRQPRRPQGQARAYRCKFCGKWHIGRENKKRRRQLREEGNR